MRGTVIHWLPLCVMPAEFRRKEKKNRKKGEEPYTFIDKEEKKHRKLKTRGRTAHTGYGFTLFSPGIVHTSFISPAPLSTLLPFPPSFYSFAPIRELRERTLTKRKRNAGNLESRRANIYSSARAKVTPTVLAARGACGRGDERK